MPQHQKKTTVDDPEIVIGGPDSEEESIRVRLVRLASAYLQGLYRPRSVFQPRPHERDILRVRGETYTPGWSTGGRDPQGLQKFQLRLIAAGLLDPDQVVSFGGPDPATFEATTKLFWTVENWGLGSPEDALAYLEATRTAGKQKPTRTIVVQRPKKMNEADLDAMLLKGGQSTLGRGLSPEEEQYIESKFRSAEARSADVSVANQRRRQEIADADAEGRGPGGMVTLEEEPDIPNPASLVQKEYGQSLDAHTFRTALYIMRLFGIGGLGAVGED